MRTWFDTVYAAIHLDLTSQGRLEVGLGLLLGTTCPTASTVGNLIVPAAHLTRCSAILPHHLLRWIFGHARAPLRHRPSSPDLSAVGHPVIASV